MKLGSGVVKSELAAIPRRQFVWLGAAIALISILWGFLPWTWSTIDDPGMVIASQGRFEEFGFLGGVWHGITNAATGEVSWGLFRPSYWVFQSTFYLLPVGIAHSVRMAMFLIVLAGPLVYLRRKGIAFKYLVAAGILLGIAAAPLARGLFFLSLQELSGAALIGLGLMFRGPLARSIAWILAAWFKSPFVWLLFAYSVYLWVEGKRRLSVINFAFALATFGISYFFARNGQYTAPRIRPTIWAMIDAAYNNGLNLFGISTALLLTAVLWFLLVSKSFLQAKGIAIVIGVGWLGYTAHMSQWEMSSYYFGPILFLLGLFLIFSIQFPQQQTLAAFTLSLSLPALILVYQLGLEVKEGLRANSVLIAVEDCLLNNDANLRYGLTGDILNVTTMEGAVRIAQNVLLRDSEWNGEVAFIDDPSNVPSEIDVLLIVGNADLALEVGQNVFCQTEDLMLVTKQ